MSSTEKQLILLVLGVGLLYLLAKKAGSLVSAATAPLTSAIADIWDSFDLPAPMNVLGNVIFPDGSLIPLAQLSVRASSSTNVVAVSYGGHLYSLQPSNSEGNWPAVLIA